MPNNNYTAYYNDHPDYVALRDPASAEYQQYVLEVDFWKNKYLSELAAGLEPDSVIEVGCAVGILLSRFPLPENTERIGVDVSDANIARAKEAFPDIHFFVGYAEELWADSQLKDHYDIGILSDILEHVDDDAGLLKLVGSKCSKVLLNLPLEKCAENEGREYGLNDRHGHLRWYDVNDARDLVARAGLKEERSIVKHYVCEPVFRKYLANKLFSGLTGEAQQAGLAKYIQEVNEIDLNPSFYKSNYFALLSR